MTPALRKLNTTAHVTFSIGWIGAVAAFLVLSISGITSLNPDVIRGAYISMNLISRFIIIPTCFAALATGIIAALGSSWGLFRYYWVVVKFGLTIVATFLLLMHQSAIAQAAQRALRSASAQLLASDFASLKTELVNKSALAVVLLVGLTVLGIYKPWGLTRYGRRKQQRKCGVESQTRGRIPSATKIIYIAGGLFLLAILLLHITGHGFGVHH